MVNVDVGVDVSKRSPTLNSQIDMGKGINVTPPPKGFHL